MKKICKTTKKILKIIGILFIISFFCNLIFSFTTNKYLVAKENLENIELNTNNIENYFEFKCPIPFINETDKEKTPFSSFEELKIIINNDDCDFLTITLKKGDFLYEEDIKTKIKVIAFDIDLVENKIYSLEEVKTHVKIIELESKNKKDYFSSLEEFSNSFENVENIYFSKKISKDSAIKKDDVLCVSGTYSPKIIINDSFKLVWFIENEQVSNWVDLVISIIGLIGSILGIIDFFRDFKMKLINKKIGNL